MGGVGKFKWTEICGNIVESMHKRLLGCFEKRGYVKYPI